MFGPCSDLEAYFETFMLTMAVAWTATYMWNPTIIYQNRLRDIVGYNNLCVGFDTDPARSIVAPGFALMGYFVLRTHSTPVLRIAHLYCMLHAI